MSSFSDVFSSIASDLTELFGQEVIFTREIAGDYDPTTGTTATTSTINYTVNVVPSDYSSEELALEHIRQGDVKLTMPNPDTLPQEGDTVDLNSRTYRIMSTNRVTVNAIDVLYELQIRI